MTRVRAKSGEVFDLPDSVATGLAGGSDGWELVTDEHVDDEPKPLEKRTAAELKAHADEHGIDLGDATKKADILAAILAAPTPDDPTGEQKPPANPQD